MKFAFAFTVIATFAASGFAAALPNNSDGSMRVYAERSEESDAMAALARLAKENKESGSLTPTMGKVFSNTASDARNKMAKLFGLSGDSLVKSSSSNAKDATKLLPSEMTDEEQEGWFAAQAAKGQANVNNALGGILD